VPLFAKYINFKNPDKIRFLNSKQQHFTLNSLTVTNGRLFLLVSIQVSHILDAFRADFDSISLHNSIKSRGYKTDVLKIIIGGRLKMRCK
jgi:hypothetical protein